MTKQTAANLAKYLLAFGVLAAVISFNWGDPSDDKSLAAVWQRHAIEGQPINGLAFLGAFLILFVCILITLVRWYILVRAQDLVITFPQAMKVGFIGIFFNAFLPGSVGGDIVKAVALARTQSRRTVAVATVIMDRAIALWALVWFVAGTGSVFWLMGMIDGPGAAAGRTVVTVAVTIVAVSLSGWLLIGFLPDRRAERFAKRLLHVPKVGGALAELWRAAWLYRRRQGAVALAMGISWVGHVGFVLGFYLCTLTLWDGSAANPIPTLAQHFLLVPIGLVINAVPLFPGGAGIGELGFGALYTWFGCGAAAGVLGSLVQRVQMWIIGAVSGILWIRMKVHHELPEDPALEAAVEAELHGEAPPDGSNGSGGPMLTRRTGLAPSPLVGEGGGGG